MFLPEKGRFFSNDRAREHFSPRICIGVCIIPHICIAFQSPCLFMMSHDEPPLS